MDWTENLPSESSFWLGETRVNTANAERGQSKRRGRQRMRWWDGIMGSTDMNLSNLWEIVEDRGVWRTAVHGVTKNQTQPSD